MVNLVKKMKFKDYLDFMNKRKKLRIYYVLLSYKEKRQLKQYVYSLNYKDYIKDVIWQYFNEPKGSSDYVLDTQLLDYLRLYNRNKKSLEL